MAQANPTSIKLYAYISAAWVELNDKGGAVPAPGSWGMSDNAPSTRLADPGSLNVTLDNSGGLYTPDGPDALAGWTEGLPAKLVITYDGQEYEYHYKIKEININPRRSEQSVNLLLLDWLDDAIEFPIVNPNLLEEATADEAITDLLALMPVQPQSISLDAGVYEFPTVFDTVRGNTRAYSELAKLSLSETGMAYLKHDGRLVFESADHRNGTQELKSVPKTRANTGFLKKADGSYLLKTDNGKILLNQYDTALFENVALNMDIAYGKNVINRWTSTAYPKRRDTESVLIYETETPIYLASGETSDPFRVFWRDPTGKRSINATPPSGNSYTKSLVHFDAQDGNDYIDELGKVWTGTDAPLIANVVKFGNGSAYLDGTGSYISSPHTPDWEFGSGDFCVEWWEYRFANTSGAASFSRDGLDAVPAFILGRSNTVSLLVYMSSDGVSNDIANGESLGAITLNTWNHFAVSRSGSNFYAFKNGALTDSWTSASALFTTASSPLYIGLNNGVALNACIDEVRITKGSAVYTAAFTAPTAPFTISGTIASMWTNDDFTGTDNSEDLVITADYGTEGATFIAENNSSSGGYVHIKTYGMGIYSDSPLENEQRDQDSIDTRGYRNDGIQQQYQYTLYAGILEGKKQVELGKNPRTVLNSISLCANTSPFHMMAFLNIDVGDLIRIKQDELGIDGWFHVQGVPFEIKGKIINFSWIVKQHYSLASGLSLMACEFAASTQDALNYGYLPLISGDNNTHRAFSAWIYLDSVSATKNRMIMGAHSDDSGQVFFVDNLAANRVLGFYSTRFTNPGRWENTANQFNTGTWVHVFVSHNLSFVSNDPVMYVNGVLQSLTETNTPSGTLKSEVGNGFVIGNWKTATQDYSEPFDGQIKDARVYNMNNTTRTVGELAIALHSEGAGGTGCYDGMVFQGPAVRTAELANYTDLTLTEDTKMLDAYLGYVGTPIDAPIARAI